MKDGRAIGVSAKRLGKMELSFCPIIGVVIRFNMKILSALLPWCWCFARKACWEGVHLFDLHQILLLQFWAEEFVLKARCSVILAFQWL